MSQTKCPKLTIRNRPGSEGKITVGANTQVELDGVPLRSVSFIKLEIHAKRVAKVMMEMYVELDVDVTIEEPKVIDEKATDYTVRKKALAIHTLSNYHPKAIAIKK